MNETIYAIGDIHGQSDMLEKLLDKIVIYHTRVNGSSSGKIIYLGDFVDRGPNSKKVLDLAMRGVGCLDSIYLKGNHEAMLLGCLETSERVPWLTWIKNGGHATLRAFDYSVPDSGFDAGLLNEKIGLNRVKWLNNLRLSYATKDILFVHAGINPDISIEKQCARDLLWIRRKFLESTKDFGVGIVHGHTPKNSPVIKCNRIGIDTDAASGHRLTALVVDGPWSKVINSPTFISVT